MIAWATDERMNEWGVAECIVHDDGDDVDDDVDLNKNRSLNGGLTL